MSKRSRSKANIPIHRESLFWILSPASCLLPEPPILPSLLRIHESIMQNKPNCCKDKTNAIPFTRRIYGNKPPHPARKKQTQSNPIPPPPPITSFAAPHTFSCSRLTPRDSPFLSHRGRSIAKIPQNTNKSTQRPSLCFQRQVKSRLVLCKSAQPRTGPWGPVLRAAEWIRG
jgi:hypothetical protein